MKKSKKFTPDLLEHAMRIVQEKLGEPPSLWVAVVSMAQKLEGVPQTLPSSFNQQEIDQGQRYGVTNDEAQRVKELEREVKELRKANES